jgi:biotin transport system substrate-specific component
VEYVGSATLADVLVPRVAWGGRVGAWARNVALMAGFAAFVALAAQVQVRVPWTTVPITGQTYAVLVAGGALGMRRGIGSMGLYALVGMFLLPVFTPGSETTSGTWDVHFILPWSGNERVVWELANGGYIVGFVLAAGLVGYLSERGIDRGPWVQVGMLAGNALLYVPGLLWLGYLIATDWTAPGGSTPLSELIVGGSDLDKTLRGGLYPFIVGDLMKLLGAAATLPAAWWVVGKMRG